MFCVECGKETSIYKNGLCINCFLKTHSFTQGPKKIDVPICVHCGSYKYKNSWTNEPFQEVLKRYIKNIFQISRELNSIDINIECSEIDQGKQCTVYINGSINEHELTEEHDLKVLFKQTTCDVCSKKYGGYHEAVLQIRADKRDLTKQEINDITLTVENMVQNLQAKGNRTLFIADIGKEHGGIDFYLSEKNTAQSIVKKLQEKYGGEIKYSSKNIGMKDSRQIYRMTYLLRLTVFQKNQYIKIDKRVYKILRIKADKIKLLNLKNWEEHTTKIDKIKNATILGGEELAKEMIIVSQNKNEIQLMDEKTYDVITIKKPTDINFKQGKINVIKTQNQTLLTSANKEK